MTSRRPPTASRPFCSPSSSALRDPLAPRAASAGRVARSGRSSDARATAGPAASNAVPPASPPRGTTGSHGSPRAAWFHRSAATQYGERPSAAPVALSSALSAVTANRGWCSAASHQSERMSASSPGTTMRSSTTTRSCASPHGVWHATRCATMARNVARDPVGFERRVRLAASGTGLWCKSVTDGPPVRSPARSEHVLACPAAPRFSMHRPARLGPRDAPLPVVHLSTHRSKIAIARPVDIAVIRHAAQEIPLGRARLSGPAEKLLLLVRACLPKRLRAYPRPNEPVLEPTLVVGVVAPGRRLCQLAAPAIDPTIAIFVRPAAAMLGLVVGSATYRRL